MKKAFKAAWKLTIPIMAGYIFLGITFGLLIKEAGFHFWTPVFMSIIIYSGALEFAAIPILSSAFNPIGTFFIGLMISARHLFYGIPMLKKYEGSGLLKIPLMFTLTDETFSVSSSVDPPEGVEKKYFYSVISIMNHSYWIIGSALGWLFGSIITFDTTGIDFVLTALFIVLFIDQLSTKQGKKGGAIGFLSTAVVLAIFGSSNMVVISMVVILLMLLLTRRILCDD